MTPMEITSDDVIPEFDCHLKVSAGPGAGKTTWLGRQIEHVARTSKRLHKAARILCISYTNVASESIRKKLGDYHEYRLSDFYSREIEMALLMLTLAVDVDLTESTQVSKKLICIVQNALRRGHPIPSELILKKIYLITFMWKKILQLIALT